MNKAQRRNGNKLEKNINAQRKEFEPVPKLSPYAHGLKKMKKQKYLKKLHTLCSSILCSSFEVMDSPAHR